MKRRELFGKATTLDYIIVELIPPRQPSETGTWKFAQGMKVGSLHIEYSNIDQAQQGQRFEQFPPGQISISEEHGWANSEQYLCLETTQSCSKRIGG